MPPIYENQRSKSGLHPRAVQSPDKLNARVTYCLYDGGALKVGTTDKHPQVRLKELQTGNPRVLRLLAYTSHVTESMAHAALGSCHLRGEWFCIALDSLDYINHWDWVDKTLMAKLVKECRKEGW